MKKKGIVIAAAMAVYCGLYAAARLGHVLVMYDGCRGEHGVHVADLGPVPSLTVIMCGIANFVFTPLMKIETVLRKRANQASEATSEPAPSAGSSSPQG